MNLKKAFVLSLCLHMAFLYYTMSMQTKGGPKGNPNGDSKVENKLNTDDLNGKNIVERPTEVTLVEQPKPEIKGPGKKSKPTKASSCKQFFGGIGVLYGNGEGEVQTVYRGYPAYDAGIMEGDIILNAGQIRGEVGTSVVVNILRGSLNLQIEMTRAKICLDDAIKELRP